MNPNAATVEEVEAAGGYSVIYADPAWAYADRNCSGAAAQHYGTTETVDMSELPIARIAAPDCALFMWGTYPLIADMLALGGAWDFKYKSIAFQWVKRYAKSGDPFFGLGRWTRGNTEGCFLFTRGKPKRISAGVSQLVETFEPEILDAPIGRHSAKPAIVRSKIVELMGDLPRVELFARERVEGWDAWGNEITSDITLNAA